MFTGIIEEIGTVESTVASSGNLSLSVIGSVVFTDLKNGDSIAINGVCQTVTGITGNIFTVTAVEQTLSKTTLGTLRKGDKVNLERALTPQTRMGGHFVLGHVDTFGSITKIKKFGGSTIITVEFDPTFKPYVVKTGSICIDGISLTVADCTDCVLMVSVIPYTQRETTLSFLKVADRVNLEFDILAKYISNSEIESKPKSLITAEWLKQHGY